MTWKRIPRKRLSSVATSQETTTKTIKTRYITRFPHIQEIVLRHNGGIVDPSTPVAALNYFGDNIVTMEAQSDPLSRTNGPPAELFQSLFNQVPMDGEMSKNETCIKHESLDGEIGDENPMSLRRLPHAGESDEKKTPAQPIRLDQRTIPNEISPVSTQGFLTECALRDFIHE